MLLSLLFRPGLAVPRGPPPERCVVGVSSRVSGICFAPIMRRCQHETSCHGTALYSGRDGISWPAPQDTGPSSARGTASRGRVVGEREDARGILGGGAAQRILGAVALQGTANPRQPQHEPKAAGTAREPCQVCTASLERTVGRALQPVSVRRPFRGPQDAGTWLGRIWLGARHGAAIGPGEPGPVRSPLGMNVA